MASHIHCCAEVTNSPLVGLSALQNRTYGSPFPTSHFLHLESGLWHFTCTAYTLTGQCHTVTSVTVRAAQI